MMPSSHKYFNIKDDIGRFLKYFTKLPTDPPFIEDKKATKDNVDVRFSIVLNEEGQTQILKSSGIALIVEKKNKYNYKLQFESPEILKTPRKRRSTDPENIDAKHQTLSLIPLQDQQTCDSDGDKTSLFDDDCNKFRIGSTTCANLQELENPFLSVDAS